MSALSHPPADNELIGQAVALGCLPPAFTRDEHPGFFQLWSDRAIDVVASRFFRSLPGKIAEADRYCGQPVEAEYVKAAA